MGLGKELKSQQLLDLIQQKKARIGIVGLGYVGLPLAIEFGKSDLKVTGIDIDEEKIKRLQKGDSYIQDVPSSDVASLVEKKILSLSSSFSIVKELDVIIICVPTPLCKTKDPDLSFIISAAEQILGGLRPGQLIILESTTYPGTTDEVLLPILNESGLLVGEDFFLAFSPERVDPGNPKFHTRNTPRVVGGMTPVCTHLATTLYQQAVEEVFPVSSSRVAEMVKLLENTFRSVNIALANETALISHQLGINVWEVIEAAATKPFGFMPFHPGPGIGGHCIPVDPFYLSWKAKQSGFEARFIDLASHINGSMPGHIVNKIVDGLNEQGKSIKNSRILILGVAYKPDIDDVRESPALDVMAHLHQKGALLQYHDPHVKNFYIGTLKYCSIEIPNGSLRDFDCVVLLTHHSSFDYRQIAEESRLVVDTRNALKNFQGEHIVRL